MTGYTNEEIEEAEFYGRMAAEKLRQSVKDAVDEARTAPRPAGYYSPDRVSITIGDGTSGWTVVDPKPLRPEPSPFSYTVAVDCPRCDGAGEEVLFMSRKPCEVCHGDGHVAADAADRERKRAKQEREKWR